MKNNEMLKKRNEKLIQMLNDAKEREAGYAQVAKLHSAYISILLNKLGATEDCPVTISGADITEALSRYEARAVYSNGKDEYSLWCEEVSE